jgi:hypothetical protein
MSPAKLLSGLWLCIAMSLSSCKREPMPSKESRMTKPVVIEVIPNKSMGVVKLGMRSDSLPPEAVVHPPSGTVDDIHFLINAAGDIDDIWIEDLRVFPHAVSCAGKDIRHDIPLDELTGIFGKCDRVPGLKGGIFFNCANGLSIGTDFSRKTLKIGVKAITVSE